MILRYKYKYVRWESEVAIEKGCTIIGVNLDGSRKIVGRTCPPIIRNIGAIFVLFSPYIIQYALENYTMHEEEIIIIKTRFIKNLGISFC